MFPYENLEVYKKAFELNRRIYRILKEKNDLPAYLKSQLGRACLSVVLNIAEGSGVERAKESCKSTAEGVSDHFVDVNQMIDLGKGGQREVDETMLTCRRRN